jgi:hypothetical protein
MPSTGSEIVRIARRHLGERYVFGAPVPKNNPQWAGPWDCAEFASWLVFQTLGQLYGCADNSCDPAMADAYTGHWARDAGAIGRRITVDEAANTPGAAVLRAPTAGVIGHIVISDGKGGTVEAHSTRRGVLEDRLSGRRWDYGVVVPGIQYTAGKNGLPVEPPRQVIYRLTTPPMTGSVVKQIQRSLNDLGYNPGGIDGVFGPMTRAAVTGFQIVKGLVADGEVGARTARALNVTLPA